MTDTLRVAAVQMVSTPDVARNLDAAARLVGDAAAAGARLVALPEYFCLMGRGERDKLAVAEGDDGPIGRALADLARRHAIWLVGGTLPAAVAHDPAHVFNRTRVFGPDGREAARYDKIHLFAFDDGRGERHDESRVLRAGAEPVAFDADGWRVGLSICYDLRFPELYRALGRPAPCDLIVVPAAFTHATGQAHWELLLRARAVENQGYVLASAQGGTHDSGRRTWGRSMLVDPWGEVVARHDEGEGVALGELRRERIADVRAKLPALAHRRLG